MSILVKNKETDEIFSFSKGSDSVMKEKLDKIGDKENQLFDDVDLFASEGLRTLVFGYKKCDSI